MLTWLGHEVLNICSNIVLGFLSEVFLDGINKWIGRLSKADSPLYCRESHPIHSINWIFAINKRLASPVYKRIFLPKDFKMKYQLFLSDDLCGDPSILHNSVEASCLLIWTGTLTFTSFQQFLSFRLKLGHCLCRFCTCQLA